MKRRKISLIATLPLIAATYCVQISAQESHLPFGKVVDYLRAEKSNTTFQNEMLAKELLGKTFEGDIQVSDVGGSPQLVQVYADFPTAHAQLEFLVSDQHLKEVAAKLSRGSKLQMSGTLYQFSVIPSPYINEPDTYRATFKDVSLRLRDG
jgi:hypothetical protein